jgi:hypothetical protein
MRTSRAALDTRSMDVVAILMGVSIFALLILLVAGIERI